MAARDGHSGMYNPSLVYVYNRNGILNGPLTVLKVLIKH